MALCARMRPRAQQEATLVPDAQQSRPPLVRKNLAAELYRRNRLLALVGWLLAVLFLAALVGLLTDDRRVMGTNTWLKPLKYVFSLMVFVWTIGWFSRWLARRQRGRRLVGIGIAASSLIVAVFLLVQAARGTITHYNMATDFDASVYSAVVVASGIAALMVGALLFMIGRGDTRPQAVYLWGMRLGIISFLSGAFVGAVMIVLGSHTVGRPDGGPGLPFLDWSTVAGDLRIAHLMGVYGLQLLPLAAYAIGRWPALGGNAPRLLTLAALALLYAAGIVLLFLQALAGRPLF